MAGYPVNVPVSGTPVLVYTPTKSGTPHVFMQNMGLYPVYIGGAGVNQTGGIPLLPAQMIDFSNCPSALYAVAAYTPTAVTTTTTAAVSAGSAVSTAITSGTGFTNGSYVLIGGTTTAETTTIASGGTTTTLVLTQLLDDHASGVAITVVTPQGGSLNVAAGTS